MALVPAPAIPTSADSSRAPGGNPRVSGLAELRPVQPRRFATEVSDSLPLNVDPHGFRVMRIRVFVHKGRPHEPILALGATWTAHRLQCALVMRLAYNLDLKRTGARQIRQHTAVRRRRADRPRTMRRSRRWRLGVRAEEPREQAHENPPVVGSSTLEHTYAIGAA
jgi:hypothetical protein